MYVIYGNKKSMFTAQTVTNLSKHDRENEQSFISHGTVSRFLRVNKKCLADYTKSRDRYP